jgi:endonuclease YncB( thermonuclease family)
MNRWVPILILAVLASPVAAADPRLTELGLEQGERVFVNTAIDGQTLHLSDGRELRLAGIEAPQALSPRTGVRERADSSLAALVGTAQTALAELAAGREVILHYERQQSDRYGRMVAHVETMSGTWVQAELLARGLARVHTTADIAAAAASLLHIEAEARQARRGLWTHPAFRIRRPEETARWLDSFQIVEGRVNAVRAARSRTWIEFEGTRGETLTLSVTTVARARFRDTKFDLQSLRGTQVRVRGWVQWLDGPLIEVDHPAQIEALER